jgi:alpha-beta hydrolase superfamily lysophospholipase
MPDSSQPAKSNPARDYAAAEARIRAFQARDTPEVSPAMRTCFLTHGARTQRAILLLHGYTNGPKMFLPLGRAFHQRGFNVLIPRAPYHGLKDRLTSAHARLTARQMLAYLTEAVDILQGLGEQVTVSGLSMGGMLTAWAAQFRPDVHLAAPISPGLGFLAIPAEVTPLVAGLARCLPNIFRWWDPALKDAPVPPLEAYPRYASRTLGHILLLAGRIQAAARRQPPRAGAVLLITNPCDEAVDNRAAERLVSSWRAAGARNVETYAFPAEYRLIHDLIDPEQPQQRVDLVYPILLDLIGSRA